MAALHGVRGINALGLLVAHKSVAMLYLPYVNRTHAASVIGMSWSVIGRVAILYTDCFILLSGTLAALSLLRQLDRTGSVRLLRRLVDRYVRYPHEACTLSRLLYPFAVALDRSRCGDPTGAAMILECPPPLSTATA